MAWLVPRRKVRSGVDYFLGFVGGLLPVLVAGCGGSISIIEVPRLTVSNSLRTARVGEPYGDRFVIAGGTAPYSFTDFYGFPGGLVFDSVTGELSGTPLVANSGVVIHVVVQDSGNPPQTAVADAILVIKPLGVSILTESLDAGNYRVYYRAQIQARDGVLPYSWKIGPAPGSLPDGLSLDKNTGEIKGTPSARGTWTFTVTVSDADSPATSYSKNFSIEIQ